MAVQSGLYWTGSETKIVGFLMRKLIYNSLFHSLKPSWYDFVNNEGRTCMSMRLLKIVFFCVLLSTNGKNTLFYLF